jgi:hypothetical protein
MREGGREKRRDETLRVGDSIRAAQVYLYRAFVLNSLGGNRVGETYLTPRGRQAIDQV